jgi:hypothetical protein
MDLIKTTLTKLVKENPEWIECLTKYPQNTKHLTPKQMTDYKSLNITNYNSDDTYKIIKKLLSSRGIRSVHPAWFFIFKEHFENDNFIFEEDTNNNLCIINLSIPENFVMPHRIQIIGTLKIYYTFLTHPKIIECFLKKRSKFVSSYSEFKELYKYLFFPDIEKKVNKKFIDLSYEFDNNCIEVEINEPEHDETTDLGREQLIYFKTNNRVVQCYLDKEVRQKNKNEQVSNILERINNCINEVLPNVIDSIFFRLIMIIFSKNEFAGLTFNAFLKEIISNLFLSIFFSELKKESLLKKLTWKKFRKYCKSVGIDIDRNFIKKILDELPDDEEEQLDDLKELFYDYTELDENTLLTETGYDYYLMQLNKKQSCNSLQIKRMYSKYKQEYDKLMKDILTEKLVEIEYIRKHTESSEYILEKIKEKFEV